MDSGLRLRHCKRRLRERTPRIRLVLPHRTAAGPSLSFAQFRAPIEACFCGALRKNGRMLFQCHSAAEKRRVPGARATAISYLERLFEDPCIGCAACHPPDRFTSLKASNVGTRSVGENTDIITAPSLIALWRTAPYMHDGSAATVREVLTTRNPHD